jgi:hypothetical protein
MIPLIPKEGQMKVRVKPVLLTAALSTVIVAVAAASGGSTASVIHGCYARKGGQLRVARQCNRGEIAVMWNKKGPAGADGARGARGPQGPTGLSEGWTAYGPPGGAITLTTTKQTVAITKPLPAGNYLFWGSAVMLAGTAEHWVECDVRLLEDSNPSGVGSVADAVGTVTAGKFSLSMNAGGVLSSAGTAKLECAESAGTGNASFISGVVTVIKVGTLH